MNAIRTLIALSAAAFATACASPDAMNAAPSMPAMPAMPAMSGMAGMAGMGDGKGTPADMAKRHQMMSDPMAMMQTMMDMMADRMPAAPASK